MGSFYTNITLRGPSQDEVVKALAQQGNQAYVSSTINSFTVVYDADCDEQDTNVIDTLGRSLSTKFDCPAFAVLNHDDDILWYRLYGHGQLVDEYDSSPGYFDGDISNPSGGDPIKLCNLMGSSNVETVASILRKPVIGDDSYLSATERHVDLVRALGLPSITVNWGFTYIEIGEGPSDFDRENLKRTW